MQSYSPYQFAIARILSGCLVITAGFVTFEATPDGHANGPLPFILTSIPAGLLLAAGIYRRGSALFSLVTFPGLTFLIFEAPMISDGISPPMITPMLAAYVSFTALMFVMLFAPSGEPLRVFPGKTGSSAGPAGGSWTLSPLLAAFALASAMIGAGLLIASIVSSGPATPSPGFGGAWFAESRCFIGFGVAVLTFSGLNLAWLLPPWPRSDTAAISPDDGVPPIVFFDGVCNLCNTSVDFLVRVDRAGILRYAPLQSDTAARLLSPDAVNDMDSMVFRDARGRLHTRSEAILRIGVQLGGLWRVGGLALWIPRGLRDALYKIIARNRYRWFGKKDSCRMPTPSERALFLT